MSTELLILIPAAILVAGFCIGLSIITNDGTLEGRRMSRIWCGLAITSLISTLLNAWAELLVKQV